MPILFNSLNPAELDLIAIPNPFVEGVPTDVTLGLMVGGKLFNLVFSNINFSGSDITSSGSLNLVPSAGGISLLPSAGNPITFGTDLQVLTNVISSLNANENIVLTPNGTGSVLTGNLGFQLNTINSTNMDGNIILSPNGMGLIILGNQPMNPPTLDSTANLFNLTSVTAGNLQLAGNTLSSVNVDGDIILAPNGFGQVILGGIVISNGNISNVNSISTINLFSVNTTTNVLTVNSRITTPEITAGNLRIVNNSIIAINNNGSIDLHADGQGNVVYHSNLDGNNNNFFNINDVITNTLHANDITITSQTVSSPIYRGWVIYNPVTDDTYKALNATIDRNGPGNYTVNWDVPPPTPFYGVNVSTALDTNGASNIANVTNQNNQSFDIVISTGRDATLYCTMFY
jgi:hypothetical protein